MLQLEIEKKYSFAIQERVMKAASMAGNMKLAMKLLDSMVSIDGMDIHDGRDRPYVPSYMAYTATLNRLRKWRKVDEMRIIMTKLSRACELTGNHLNLIAFNTYLAALCDNTKYFASTSSRGGGPTSRQHRKWNEANGGNIDEARMDLLEEAIELLQPGVSLKRFNMPKPDTTSFNTVLNTVASVRNQTLVEEVYQSMKAQGVDSDIYTYNAMLKAASSLADRIPVIDAILGTPNIKVDRYTIELALLPLAKEGRIGDILNLLKDFGNLNLPEKVVANAYSTFLLALVKGGEVDIARAIFDICILSPSLEQSDSTIHFLKQARQESCDIQFQSTVAHSRPQPIERHFNALFEGYRSVSTSKLWSEESESFLTPQEHCNTLFNHMKAMNVSPDLYSVTLLMGLQKTTFDINNIWNSIMEETDIELTPPIYHSIISAYGRAGDAASACYVFHRMACINGFSHSLNTWNVILSALSKASAINPSEVIDTKGAFATLLNSFEIDVDHDPHPLEAGMIYNMTFADIVDGLTPFEASKKILDLMNDAKQDPEISNKVYRPNSQSYCLVASALSHSLSANTSQNRQVAMDLYQSFEQNDLPIDGRVLNAIIRCFSDEILEALDIWKTVFRKAALDTDEDIASAVNVKFTKRFKNLMAAYNGLLYVSGQAYRPDIALRLVYAMAKDGVEPTEASLNCYNAGARKRDPDKGKIRLHSQYENMLMVECTKYDAADKRRSADKRVRIII